MMSNLDTSPSGEVAIEMKLLKQKKKSRLLKLRAKEYGNIENIIIGI